MKSYFAPMVDVFTVCMIVGFTSCKIPEEVIAPFDEYTGVAVGDINIDGALDIVVASSHLESAPPHPGYILVYLQMKSSPGTFSMPVKYTVGPDPWEVTLADLNGDGKLDIVTAGEQSPNVFILFSDTSSTGEFQSVVSYPCGQYPHAVAAGDLNSDHLPDLAVAMTNGTASVALLFQDPQNPGEFLPAKTLTSAPPSISIAVGDLNSDGLQDLAVTGDNGITILQQTPGHPGSFDAPQVIPTGVQPIHVAIADLNLDHHDDIVVANEGSPTDGSNASVSVILNGHTAKSYPSPDGSHSLVVTDLNGDGRPDVAIATVEYQDFQHDGNVAVMLQDTTLTGTLLPAALYGAGFTPIFIAAGDLNQDGKIDLLINEGPSIFFQNPSQLGAFLARVRLGN